MKLTFVLVLLMTGLCLHAQQLPVADLYRMLDLKNKDLQDYLKDKGYKLSEKDSSVTASSWYYTALEKKDTVVLSLRSVTLMETAYKDYQARMIAYRTYMPEEHTAFMSYISANGYILSDSYKTNDKEEFFYKKEDKQIHYTIAYNKTANGNLIKSYTIEIGD